MKNSGRGARYAALSNGYEVVYDLISFGVNRPAQRRHRRKLKTSKPPDENKTTAQHASRQPVLISRIVLSFELHWCVER
jgi:hypothetical protein